MELRWNGKMLEITSFSEDGNSLTACTCKPRMDDDYSNKVATRTKITWDELNKAHRELLKQKREIKDDKAEQEV